MNFDEQAFHSYFASADRQTRLLPSTSSIEQFARYITRIQYRGSHSTVSLTVLPHIVRLTHLRVFHHSSKTLQSLIRRNAATLVSIHWEEQHSSRILPVPVPEDWVHNMFSTIADCLQLRHLALIRTTVSEGQLAPFYATLRRLRTLSLAGTCVRGFVVQDLLSLPALVSLSLLSVEMNPTNQFELIASCPNLATLGWKAPMGPISMGSYAQIVSVKSPLIQNLDISGCECSDALMAQVIKGSPYLSRLDAPNHRSAQDVFYRC